MNVLEIVKIQFDSDGYTIFAMVDEMQLLYEQTMHEPAEYCPALCKAFLLADDEADDEAVLPAGDNKLLAYINDCNLNWVQVS
jgi:hypothetical protein